MKLSEPNVLKVRLHHVELGRPIPTQKMRVMLTGDWHISPIVSERQLEFLKDALRQARPDLIILQGDIVDSPIELRRETSLKKLLAELSACAKAAPTVMVLGSHDYITSTVPVKNMEDFALPFWKKVCKKCGVKLLINDWATFPGVLPGIRVFGAFQDEKCLMSYKEEGSMRYEESPEKFLECLNKSRAVIEAGIKKADREAREIGVSAKAGMMAEADTTEEPKKLRDVLWFAAHAPFLNDEVVKRLEPFDFASFGHTHGGIVPLGLDEVFEKFGWHFGLISATHKPFPQRVRGVTPISNSTMLAVNPGMIATHFCVSKPLQNMNFIKAAEVSVIEIDNK